MASQKVIAAIDIGTDKCATVIAVVDPETNLPRVVGLAAEPSKGVKRSQIINLEQVTQSITKSLDAAERMAGLEIKSAYLSVSGSHIKSQNSKGVVAISSPNQEVSQLDVDRVIEAAQAISLPTDREIIHTIPKSYKIDSQEGIKDPIGMTGIRLEVETHMITALTIVLKNMERCVNELGVEVEEFVFAGLANSEVISTETEKELGSVVVDLGAGSTDLAIWVENSLELSVSLPVGARHITQDIALGCRLSLEQAEQLKLYLSNNAEEILKPIRQKPSETKSEFAKRKKKADELNLLELGITQEPTILSKKRVVEGIIYPRIKEIMILIGETLEKHGLLDRVPAGLVITGGGAKTIGLTHVAKQVLSLPAQIGQPHTLSGVTNEIYDLPMTTALGLIHYAHRYGQARSSGGFNLNFAQIFNPNKLKQTLAGLVSTILPRSEE